MSIIAILAAATLGYTYLGYPLILAILARRAPARAPRSAEFTPTVSILVPVFNGVRYVAGKLATLRGLDYPADRVEILFYSDGSTDGTAELAAELASDDPRVRVLRSEVRRGKPTALNELAGVARGEVLLLTDIRQPLAPGALHALVARLQDPTVGCVSGNLVLQGQTGAGIYWRYENWMRRKEAAVSSMLGVTGPIYALRAADMAPLPSDVILDDMWVPLRLRLMGRRIEFAVGALAYDEAFGTQREFGRKVRTLAGNFQLLLLLPGLLNPFRNPSFFEFFSHKLLRLASPFLLVALLASSASAAIPAAGSVAPWPTALLIGQAGLYLLALFPALGGRAGTAARAFVVMNAAAVVGLVRFLSRTQKVTW